MKIMVVCGMGMGTSHVLRASVKKALDQLGLQASIEISDVAIASSADADIWIALPEFAKALEGRIPRDGILIEVKSVVDVNHLKNALEEGLSDKGSKALD
jgi:PTS system ascorbate-specific IIB component